ncbi:hypothetical protein C884_02258 [Kocuria palustris PEL]|uniref:Uncharacterized protein n=1 Tax=Kocuria palustris PEL TaxID=1236550 RepID=M2XVU4_9MICC|nr:hypothetical protein C884_02258 [Kocuria palustris PEL]
MSHLKLPDFSATSEASGMLGRTPEEPVCARRCSSGIRRRRLTLSSREVPR